MENISEPHCNLGQSRVHIFCKNIVFCLFESFGKQIKGEFHAICFDMNVSGFGVQISC